MGFALQNRGGLFTSIRGIRTRSVHANAPSTRHPPGFMQRGPVQIAFGIMGGWNQAQAHAQFVSNIADHDMNLQAALDAARFTKLTFDGPT